MRTVRTVRPSSPRMRISWTTRSPICTVSARTTRPWNAALRHRGRLCERNAAAALRRKQLVLRAGRAARPPARLARARASAAAPRPDRRRRATRRRPSPAATKPARRARLIVFVKRLLIIAVTAWGRASVLVKEALERKPGGPMARPERAFNTAPDNPPVARRPRAAPSRRDAGRSASCSCGRRADTSRVTVDDLLRDAVVDDLAALHGDVARRLRCARRVDARRRRPRRRRARSARRGRCRYRTAGRSRRRRCCRQPCASHTEGTYGLTDDLVPTLLARAIDRDVAHQRLDVDDAGGDDGRRVPVVAVPVRMTAAAAAMTVVGQAQSSRRETPTPQQPEICSPTWQLSFACDPISVTVLIVLIKAQLDGMHGWAACRLSIRVTRASGMRRAISAFALGGNQQSDARRPGRTVSLSAC